MKLIKKGKVLERIWTGSCRRCGSEFEDTEFNVQSEGFEIDIKGEGDFAIRNCPECGIQSGVILYPKKEIYSER